MKRCVCFYLFACLAAFSQAGPAVATLTSVNPFTLEGRTVSTPGVTSFPLVVGDAVRTPSGPALLFFLDGSKVKLAMHSSIQLAGSAAKPKLVLLSGSLDYKLVRGSILAVTNLDLERKQAQLPQSAGVRAEPAPPLRPERAMLAALDSPIPLGASFGQAAGNPSAPPFVIPLSGASLLLRLPAVSRHF